MKTPSAGGHQPGTEYRCNPFRFQGFYYDPAAGSYNAQAREYRPDVQRFLTQDRYEASGSDLGLAANPLTSDRYAYVAGNPTSRIDYDGHAIDAGGGVKIIYTCAGCPSHTIQPPPPTAAQKKSQAATQGGQRRSANAALKEIKTEQSSPSWASDINERNYRTVTGAGLTANLATGGFCNANFVTEGLCTSTGLEVYARLDEGAYPDKLKISEEQIAAINLVRDDFHGEWNYTIKPSPK